MLLYSSSVIYINFLSIGSFSLVCKCTTKFLSLKLTPNSRKKKKKREREKEKTIFSLESTLLTFPFGYCSA